MEKSSRGGGNKQKENWRIKKTRSSFYTPRREESVYVRGTKEVKKCVFKTDFIWHEEKYGKGVIYAIAYLK